MARFEIVGPFRDCKLGRFEIVGTFLDHELGRFKTMLISNMSVLALIRSAC